MAIISWVKNFILIIGDIATLYLSLYLALLIRYREVPAELVWRAHFWPFSITFLVWIGVFYIAGLYNRQIAKNDYVFYTTVLKTIALTVAITIFIFYANPSFDIAPKTTLLLMVFIFLALFLLWRRSYNALIKSESFLNNIIFIGANKESLEIMEMLRRNPQLGYKAWGEINYSEAENIKSIIEKNGINTVVHIKNPAEREDMAKILCSLIPLEVSIVELPRFYAQIARKVPISIIGETWFLENLIESEKSVYKMWKRLLDIALALALSIIFLPFLPLIALAIKLDSHGPVFYTQTRTGKNGWLFQLIKFRTMIENAEQKGAQWTAQKDNRVTKVGSVLRKLRVDELPQLWNVLLGDMSFVGPRPERPEFIQTLEKEVPFYQMRHLVKPGLTGLAQINGPLLGAGVADSLEKLQYDLYYIRQRSVVIDFDILFKTIPVVLGRKGH